MKVLPRISALILSAVFAAAMNTAAFGADSVLSVEAAAGAESEIQESESLGKYIFDAKRVSVKRDNCSFGIDIPAEFAVENNSANAPFTIDEGLANPIFTAYSGSDSITAVLVECDGGIESREEFWEWYTPNTDLDGNDFYCSMESTTSYTLFHAEYPCDDNSYISFDILYESKIDMDIADNIFYALFSFSKNNALTEGNAENDSGYNVKRFSYESGELPFSIDVPEEIYSLIEVYESDYSGDNSGIKTLLSASDGANLILQADLLYDSYESEIALLKETDGFYCELTTHTNADGSEFTLVEVAGENAVMAVYDAGDNRVLMICSELISADYFTALAESLSMSASKSEESGERESPDTGVGAISLAVPALAAMTLAISRRKK